MSAAAAAKDPEVPANIPDVKELPLKPGTTVLVIGSRGTGKSTLVKELTKQYFTQNYMNATSQCGAVAGRNGDAQPYGYNKVEALNEFIKDAHCEQMICRARYDRSLVVIERQCRKDTTPMIRDHADILCLSPYALTSDLVTVANTQYTPCPQRFAGGCPSCVKRTAPFQHATKVTETVRYWLHHIPELKSAFATLNDTLKKAKQAYWFLIYDRTTKQVYVKRV